MNPQDRGSVRSWGERGKVAQDSPPGVRVHSPALVCLSVLYAGSRLQLLLLDAPWLPGGKEDKVSLAGCVALAHGIHLSAVNLCCCRALSLSHWKYCFFFLFNKCL